MPNSLIHETSPYLLQHANNPVNWEPWGATTFERAVQENKLVIVSIGYSACHWCHVMEHESFEDEQVAKLMNGHFVCIKVDREERPDVDQFYMDAAQLMVGRGGWPLNAIALPDGRPVYAGTYFPKTSWMGLLNEIAYGYKKQPDKYLEYAAKLVAGIKGLSIISLPDKVPNFKLDDLDEAWGVFAGQFDRTNGGRGRAPKFPMPDNWFWALQYFHLQKNEEAKNQTMLTLDKMAKGGIYDQLGGGFSRYATDAEWKVPHFEKMLYDNAQLVSLYSEAYKITGNERYKKTVYETVGFVNEELTSPEGGFYCALDADSEGIEGKFYVWTSDEIKQTIEPKNLDIVNEYFGIDADGLWEHNNNILLVAKSIQDLANEHQIDEKACQEIIGNAKLALLKVRNHRPKPGLDNKILLSWNALMSIGLLDAYHAFGEPGFLAAAEKNLVFVREKMTNEGKIYHSYKSGEAKISGFLEDYALYIKALIKYHQTVLHEPSILEAKALLDHVIHNFQDPLSGFFWFTSLENNELAARKIETSDNVIASANSTMAHNLFEIGKLFCDDNYTNMAKNMVLAILPQLVEQPAYYSNWALLLAHFVGPHYEVVFTGNEALSNIAAFNRHYCPNKIMAGSKLGNDSLPILQNKNVPGKSYIYVCEGSVCQKPVEAIPELLTLVQ